MSTTYSIKGSSRVICIEDLMYSAHVAHAGGLFETEPTTAEEAIEAFSDIGIEIEEVAQ